MNRISSIDFTRGLVMLIMALDHVRDLMHTTSLTQDPTDLSTTTPALFLTRWITHLCAPTFVFLSGTSAYLSLKSQGRIAESARFLRTRGLWLIVLELTVINFSFWFDIHFRTLLWQVIGAIGAGFVILSFLLRVPVRVVGVLGLLIVFGHNLLPNASFAPNGSFVWAWLFQPNIFTVSPRFTLGILYPVIPWLGIMLTGYACGRLFERPLAQRRRLWLAIGVATLSLFTLIRLTNLYGDPVPWAPQKTGLFTVLSFINCTKYPPSLLYTLMTIGISSIVLAVTDGVKNRLTDIVSVYGKVPLFYYLIHWYVIHSAMVVMVLLQGYRWNDLIFGPFRFGRPEAGSGVDLPYIYLIWLGVIVALYPLCKWYSQYKASRRDSRWLRYV
ncbi:DUF1624 domain-containing protein [Nibrella saemangeumensis]|uniref:DUF1624 domain-containing protein n=1 Tax=Nibrella saemangeumensis TaxID=1084526 RepID=A0ABP8NM48_9BACT